MDTFQWVLHDPILFPTLMGILGAMIGSFLNVVIYRYPIMLKQAFEAECLAFMATTSGVPDQILPAVSSKKFNLWLPRSQCPACKTPIAAWFNIPIISYFYLRGRCQYCRTPISIRYLCVELLTLLLSAFLAHFYGFQFILFPALLFAWFCIAMSFIDLSHQLLPDALTLSLLWLGILFNLNGTFTELSSSVIGAVAGYLLFWIPALIYFAVTNREGMGHGDFKLLAAIGAWFGWTILPFVILLSSCLAIAIGVPYLLQRKQMRSPLPFGPFLAVAGLVALLYGSTITEAYLHYAGLH